jgi:ABC-type transporter Mla subunit MlaD
MEQALSTLKQSVTPVPPIALSAEEQQMLAGDASHALSAGAAEAHKVMSVKGDRILRILRSLSQAVHKANEQQSNIANTVNMESLAAYHANDASVNEPARLIKALLQK